MNKEIATLQSFPAWEPVPRPNRKIMRGKWVFKRKLNPDGTISKYRARFVAQGYRQTKGIDYHETFSLVVSATALRMVIATAAKNNWTIRQRDVVLAYLNGELEEELYMEQPDGSARDETKVCRLRRALYGLKQSGRVWNHKIHTELLRLGLIQLPSEPCVYVLSAQGGKARIVIAIYVDDIIIAGPDAEFVHEIEEKLPK